MNIQKGEENNINSIRYSSHAKRTVVVKHTEWDMQSTYGSVSFTYVHLGVVESKKGIINQVEVSMAVLGVYVQGKSWKKKRKNRVKNVAVVMIDY